MKARIIKIQPRVSASAMAPVPAIVVRSGVRREIPQLGQPRAKKPSAVPTPPASRPATAAFFSRCFQTYSSIAMVRPCIRESKISRSPSQEVKFSSTRCHTESPASSLSVKGSPDQKIFQVPVPFLKSVRIYTKINAKTMAAMAVFGRRSATPIPTIDILVSSTQRSKVFRNFFIISIIAEKITISRVYY